MDAAATPPGDRPAASDVDLASLGDLVRDAGDYAQALARLAALEAHQAKVSLPRLLIVALLLPAIAVCAALAIDAGAATLLAAWLHDWTWAIGLVAAANVVLLLGALQLLRSWWRALSLPRTRAAIAELRRRS